MPTSAPGPRPGCSRSAPCPPRSPTVQLTPPPRRIVRGPSRVDPRRTASRVCSRACLSLTEILRTTGGLQRRVDYSLGRRTRKDHRHYRTKPPNLLISRSRCRHRTLTDDAYRFHNESKCCESPADTKTGARILSVLNPGAHSSQF